MTLIFWGTLFPTKTLWGFLSLLSLQAGNAPLRASRV